jgi:hypothetical protein
MDYRIKVSKLIPKCFYIFKYVILEYGYGYRYMSIDQNYSKIREVEVDGVNDEAIPASLRSCMKIASLHNCLDKFKEMYYLDKEQKQ